MLMMLLCAGCATPPPASQTKEPVCFRSVPAGAEVFVDGERLGQTPIDGALISKATHRVTLRKTGYEEMTTYIAPRPRNPFVHLLTLGLLENTAEFDTLQSTYKFEMQPIKTTDR
jgi:hypothetical protein